MLEKRPQAIWKRFQLEWSRNEKGTFLSKAQNITENFLNLLVNFGVFGVPSAIRLVITTELRHCLHKVLVNGFESLK
jgi:hypothetical protein